MFFNSLCAAFAAGSLLLGEVYGGRFSETARRGSRAAEAIVQGHLNRKIERRAPSGRFYSNETARECLLLP